MPSGGYGEARGSGRAAVPLVAYPDRAGTSFPIKRKDFDAALADTPVASLHDVLSRPQIYRSAADYFWGTGLPEPRNIDASDFLPLASATWQGIDGASELSPAMTAHVNIYGVPSERRTELHDRMVDEGLPLLLGWVRTIEQGPETGRTVKRRLAVYLNRDRLEHTEG
jgi:hypothetical protein